MGKQILIILGSPRRNGNSALLAHAVAAGAEAQGAAAETVFLNGLDIRPCQGCEACQKSGSCGCVLRDDMIPLYAAMDRACAVVLASPIYWFHVSAQAKTFIDRLHGLPKDIRQRLAGKRLALALAYAGPDPVQSGAANAIRSFQDICRHVGAAFAGSVYGRAWDPGEIEGDATVMEQARELGRMLAAD